MTRLVGKQDRSEFEPDPQQAYHRGRKLDGLLAGALPGFPRGVFRATHRALNEMDDARARAIAQRLNPSA